MITHFLYKLSLLGTLLFLVSACATSPIAEQYRKAAKADGVTFSMVFENPDAYVGDTVLWGGSVIETINTEEGTEILILESPLDKGDMPEYPEYSRGRFIAVSSNFLDPAIYKEEAEVSLAGQVAGKKTLPLGKTTYTYPLVMVNQIHLWKRGPYYTAYPYRNRGWWSYWDWNLWLGF